MRLSTRKFLDKSFTGIGLLSILFMGGMLFIILAPICVRGLGAFVFRGTIEHRLVMRDRFDRMAGPLLDRDIEKARESRKPVYEMIQLFEEQLSAMPRQERSVYRSELRDLKRAIHSLLGPPQDAPMPVLIRNQYGQTRWDRAIIKRDELLYKESWDYSDPTQMGKQVLTPRKETFEGTSLEPLFDYVENNLEEMLLPRLTFYRQFLTDRSFDAHFFGGIWAELLGTLYLTLGAMIFAVPMGVLAAIYLCEYAPDNRTVGLLRTFISTLAGVPSIVFGLFGLSFFINTIRVSPSKSVLAGSLTLALLILPTVIRASEEAIRAVPEMYKEAALSLGAGKWHTVRTVMLPAALPGIITGIIISMGRAAGETAPIIFTAAVSMGLPLKIWETLNQPTPALPWNIYNLCTEHEAVDEIRHVQYGMVFTLVMLVLILNISAIIIRARISRRLRGAT